MAFSEFSSVGPSSATKPTFVQSASPSSVSLFLFSTLADASLTIGTISILILRPAQIAQFLPDVGLAKPFFHSPSSSWVEDSFLSRLSAPPAGLFALCIIICILAYTKWHKINPTSFFFMAGARALIYPTAAFSLLSWNQFTQSGDHITALLILLGVGLGGYILGISLTARAETSKDPISDARKTFPILCLCAPIFFFSAPLLLTNNGNAIPPARPLYRSGRPSSSDAFALVTTSVFLSPGLLRPFP